MQDFMGFATGGCPIPVATLFHWPEEDQSDQDLVELFTNEAGDVFMLADSYRSDYGRWDSELSCIVFNDGYFDARHRLEASRLAGAYLKRMGK